jgi:O-antigen/teichoic acid export membrane protein
MGIIIKQSIKGSIWSYLGVIIGFVTTTYLYTEYLTPDVVGLFGLLIAYSTLFGQISLLGLPGITARLFPLFRDKKNSHNGFLFLSSMFFILGFLLFLTIYFIFSPYLSETNLEKSRLFSEYIFLLIPLTFFSMIFVLLDTYNKVLYDAVFGTFLQEFLQRSLIFTFALLFAVKLISLNQLIIYFAASICVKGLVMIVFLWYKKDLNFRPQINFINRSLRREIFDVALFSLIGGLGSMLVFNIDKIVINQILDLSNTGVYTIAFYFGSLVVIPSRPLLKISGTLIADAWAVNNLKKINEIYRKSCLNQFIVGGFLFIGIWMNIDNILIILGDDYYQSKWVIFFIGLGYLFDMMTGANAQIIGYSKYYRITLVFIVVLILTVLSLLYFLIPIWGITGAAIAIATALLLNNSMRYIFLLHKYKMQPFNYKHIIVAFFFTGIYFLIDLIPQQYFIIDIVIRGASYTLISALFFILFPISEELSAIFSHFFRYFEKNV